MYVQVVQLIFLPALNSEDNIGISTVILVESGRDLDGWCWLEPGQDSKCG